MSREQASDRELLAGEIAQARAYLEGKALSEQRLDKLSRKSLSKLIQSAQVLREAVMLRQQREVAEHVRAAIERDRASLRAERSTLTS